MGRKRVPAGSFDRLSSSGALWRAWCAYREGKRRRAHVAAFDIEADRHLFALGRSAPAHHLGGPEPREGRGLPVGSLVSHFSGALYLDRLDHYVKRELKVPAYLRFMDDVLLLTDDRDELAAAWSAVAHWLATERDLTLKPTREGIVSTRAGLTLLGWRVTRAGLQPARTGRRRLLRRLRHRIHRGPGAVRDALAAAEHRWRFG